MGTRANVETFLVKRRGKLMTFVGMATTVVGANADLNDPIGYAVRILGGIVANPAEVTDADIDTAVAESELDAVVDVAELRLIKSIKGNLDVVDITSGPFTEKFSQLAKALEEDIKTLATDVEAYGISSVSVEAGVVQLNIGSRANDPALIDDSLNI